MWKCRVISDQEERKMVVRTGIFKSDSGGSNDVNDRRMGLTGGSCERKREADRDDAVFAFHVFVFLGSSGWIGRTDKVGMPRGWKRRQSVSKRNLGGS